MEYETSVLLVGFAAQVGKGPAKAWCGELLWKTNLCVHVQGSRDAISGAETMGVPSWEDVVFSAIPSFVRVPAWV